MAPDLLDLPLLLPITPLCPENSISAMAHIGPLTILPPHRYWHCKPRDKVRVIFLEFVFHLQKAIPVSSKKAGGGLYGVYNYHVVSIYLALA
uniref:Uncharacterized protein n=1 Tax=Pyxicephalus adspersus TaxID=30357 RepID=A0AAV3AEH8_PYXAD|nr:TPA: hypothetical protein GDO54_010018 [Pyxicephalus adspersus]